MSVTLPPLFPYDPTALFFPATTVATVAPGGGWSGLWLMRPAWAGAALWWVWPVGKVLALPT